MCQAQHTLMCAHPYACTSLGKTHLWTACPPKGSPLVSLCCAQVLGKLHSNLHFINPADPRLTGMEYSLGLDSYKDSTTGINMPAVHTISSPCC
jgi:hypothetical protein